MDDDEIDEIARQLASDPRALQIMLRNMAIEAVQMRTVLETIAERNLSYDAVVSLAQQALRKRG